MPFAVPFVSMFLVVAQMPGWFLVRPVADQPTPPSITEIEERITALEEQAAPDPNRDEVLAAYRAAIASLRSRDEIQRTTDQRYREDIGRAEQIAQELRAQLAVPASPPTIDASQSSLADMELKLQVLAGELSAAREQLAQLEGEPTRRQERRRAIPGQLLQLRETLDATLAQLTELRQSKETDPLTQAKEAALLARYAETSASVTQIELENQYYDQRREVLPLRTQLLRREIQRTERLQQLWQEAAAQARSSQAAENLRQAREELTRVRPELRSLVEQNLNYAQERTEPQGSRGALVDRISELEDGLIDLRARYENLRARTVRTQERLTSLGREAGAQLLAGEFRVLPDVEELNRTLQQHGKEIRPAQSRQLEIEQLFLTGADTEAEIAAVVDRLEPSLDETTREEIRARVRELLEQRNEYRRLLRTDYTRYVEVLIEHSTLRREMIRRTAEFTQLINEHLTWVQHDPLMKPADLVRVARQVGGAFAEPRWRALPQALTDARVEAVLRAVLVLAVAMAALALRLILRRRLDHWNELTASWTTDAFSHTIRALIDVVLIASTAPAVAWALSWYLFGLEVELADAIGRGLRAAMFPLFMTTAVLWVVRKQGMAAVHFRWSKAARLSVRRHTRWFRPVLVGTVFLSGFFGRSTEPAEVLVERSLRIVFLLEIGLFLAILLRPTGPTMVALARGVQNTWFVKLRFALYGGAVLVPFALGALVAVGYTYTSGQLQNGFIGTLLLVVGLILLHVLTLRWLFVTRRQVAIEQARAQREAALAAEESAGAEGQETAEGASELPEIKEPIVDMAAVDQQTRNLLKSTVGFALILGVWFIWDDLLPALRVFESFTLWPSQTTLPDGTVQVENVTLANLLLSGVVVLISLLAARDVPGLLEIAVLKRLPMKPGTRYAIVTLSRYVITVIGVVLAFGWLGVSWSKIQWLIAAMTVGLGFGLQEIFANFVSGLIILFERPIRVGDVVTIGDVTGKVSQLRIRATTITNFDRKELLVPNKEFITGRLINWTLSDTILRMVIPIGVQYGADKEVARAVLVRTAKANPKVLADPAPEALLHSFGNDSVVFELRVYLQAPDFIPVVRHELISAAERDLNASGIEISFPQRDLHLRSIDPEVAALLGGRHEKFEPESKGDDDAAERA